MSKIVSISINNFEKYNPRKDFKNPRWFAFNNRILEDPDFFDFSGDELKAFIYILCQASQKNSKHVMINYDHAKRVCLIKPQVLDITIKKLIKLEICTESVRDLYGSVQDLYSTIQNSTIQNKTEQYTNAQNEQTFERELDLIYFNYPKKIGKKKGLQTLAKVIKTKDQINALTQAVKNYSSYVKNTDPKFIKQFDTFANCWQDWIEVEEKKKQAVDLGGE